MVLNGMINCRIVQIKYLKNSKSGCVVNGLILRMKVSGVDVMQVVWLLKLFLRLGEQLLKMAAGLGRKETLCILT